MPEQSQLQLIPTMLLLFVRDADSVGAVFTLFEEHDRRSGSRLNPEKTFILAVGVQQGPLPGRLTNVFWLMLLGVGLASHWLNLTAAVCKSLNDGRRYNLPLPEKAYLCKLLILAKCWCAVKISVPPTYLARRIMSAVHSYLWSDKPESACRSALQLSQEHGGWSVPCVNRLGAACNTCHP